jgi:hypothetical protein
MSGYNEDAYRQARETVIDLPCPFERALLSCCVACFKARKLLLAEREAITCSEREANSHCKAFHEALHHNARFALHMDPSQPWPFGKEIRAQCGGVLGLKGILAYGEEVEANVAELVSRGIEKFTTVDQFPYSEIMRAIVHYEPRKRRDK